MKNGLKVSFCNRELWKQYLSIISVLSAFATLISIFYGIPQEVKLVCAVLFIVALIIIFLIVWWRANRLESAHLEINQTKVNIVVGDILRVKDNELNVIGFNEYFDTQVDNRIIAENTVHGRFIKMHEDWVGEIDNKVIADEILNKYKFDTNHNRIEGKKDRYQLGSMFEIHQYVITAFTKFDENNKAYLYANDYLDFWMNFWKCIDDIYAGRTINIPLMGAGITRFKDGKPTKQELLETMLWLLKISGFSCTYKDKSINFIIYEGDKDEINFYRLQRELSLK